MKKMWLFFEQGVERLNRLGVIAAELSLVLLLLLVFHEVVSRYIFDKPTTYSVELSEYLLLFGAFVGAGWVMREDKHVRMHSFTNLLPPRVRQVVSFFMSTIVLCFCTILIWQGTKAALMAFRGGYHSSSLLNVPMWIPYSIIPLGSFLLALQVVVLLGNQMFSPSNKIK